MNNVYRDTVCLVTGAASGIGRAVAEQLAGFGARVIATDINVPQLEEAMAPLVEQGRAVTTMTLDVRDYNAFTRVVDEIVARHGRLDYIFNNAGLAIVGEVRDTEIEDWKKVFSVNLDDVVHGSLLAYKQMVRQGHGHIVNVASVEGLIPFPATVSYVTTKFGVVGLSQGLWVEGKDLGVDVSVVCPGWIRTNIVTGAKFVNMDRDCVPEAVKLWIRFSVSPEECARVMLRGVARKKRIITVTGLARIMWWIARISPTLMMTLARRDFARWRDKARIGP